MASPYYSVDLHTHTCHSDGMDTPTQLVAKAAHQGIRSLAVTDHDTVDAIAEARQAGALHGIEVLTGIELSVQYQQYDDIHLLAYGFDPTFAPLGAHLARLQEGRVQRGLEILQRINVLLTRRGQAPLESTQVLQQAQGVLTRPHLAQVLLEHGYSSTVQNAFRDFLIPCNVPKAALSPEEALAVINQAGGICALAHPGALSGDQQDLHWLLGALKAMGMVGVEVYHRQHYPDAIAFFQACAVRYGLIATGGSDYHGRPNGATLGEIAPGYVIPEQTLYELRRALARQQRESS